MLIFQGVIDQEVYSKVIVVASHHFDCVSLPIFRSKRFDHPMILGGLSKIVFPARIYTMSPQNHEK